RRRATGSRGPLARRRIQVDRRESGQRSELPPRDPIHRSPRRRRGGAMKSVTIARNYAEALFDAADAGGTTERYGEFIDAVAGAVQSDPRIAAALDSPRV